MAIRRPPTTFSDSITGADLASDIAISTTGNIATTGSGTLSVAGNSTLSGTNNLGSNPTVTLGSNATFPTGMIIKTYYAELTTYGSTYADDTWHTILSVTTDVPASTSSDFILSGHLTYGVSDWGIKTRFYNSTTSTAISVNTNTGVGNRIQGSWTSSAATISANNENYMYLCSGCGKQTNNTGVAQTFLIQAYSGRGSFYVNRSYSISSNDDISDQLGTTAFVVMEVA